MKYKALSFSYHNNLVSYPHFTSRETKPNQGQFQCPPANKCRAGILNLVFMTSETILFPLQHAAFLTIDLTDQ